MTDRERAFAALGLEYAEGIEACNRFEVPTTGREVRKNPNGKWEAQPWNDNYWKEFDDPLDALKFASRPVRFTCTGPVRGNCGHLHRSYKAASECIAEDHDGCASQGGYSDRRILAVDPNGMSRRPTEEEAGV